MLSLVATSLGLASAAAADPAVDETSATVLKKFAGQFKGVKSLRLEIDSNTTVEKDGVKNTFRNAYEMAIAKPNKLSARLIDGQQGITSVSDGKRLLLAFPALRRYSLEAVPETIDEIMGAGTQRSVNLQQGLLYVTTLMTGDDPVATYLEDITAAKHVGIEDIGGQKCHHLRLDFDPMAWDIWIDTSEQPLLRQASPDLQGFFSAQNGGELPDGLKLSSKIAYKSWQLNAAIEPETFTIEPPTGLQRVDSLFGNGPSEEEIHELVGAPAPAFKLETLAGGHADTAAMKDKVVILDFWASWCGPCVRALPTIAGVAKKYESKGVLFYAVNLQEDKADIEAFLTEHKLKVPVALDKTGKVATAYGASAIPQTVLLGKDGTVQVVHVGLSEDFEQRLTKELDALVAGKNLAADALKEQAIETSGLKSVWTKPGKYRALAGDGRGELVATAERLAEQIDVTGKVKDAFALALATRQLKLFHPRAKEPADLLSFEVWTHQLVVQRAGGDVLWTHKEEDGIDDVTAVDLDGDGLDNIVISYNGSGGLVALAPDGNVLWRFKEISNAWHVAAGNVTGDAAPEIISTSAEGHLYVFNTKGELLKKIDPQCYAMHVGVFTRGGKEGTPGLILTAGTLGDREHLVAVDFDGKVVWKLPLETTRDAVDSLTFSGTRPWAAMTTADGRIHVVDLTDGKFIAKLTGRPPLPAAWLERGEASPLLVVSTGRKLEAFEVEGK